MANIYLRIPTYVAQFYRGLDDKKPLDCQEPYEFCRFQHEYLVMKNSLVLINESDQRDPWCFSQRAWNNILRGKSPTGGPAVLKRDADEWPTISEICTLLGEKNVQKMEGYDYFCIQMPPEVMMGDIIRRTNGSYSLRRPEAMMMVRLLRDEFIHVFLDWLIQDRRYCNRVGIHRPIGTTIERFFERYHIFIGTSKKERDSMYRMGRRWLEDAHLLPNDRVDFSDSDIHYEGERERELADHFDFVAEIDREMADGRCKM